MPRHAREAMLRGIDENEIIVGAYTGGRDGGICPMLAAHRNGGRTDLASFARSWDRYTAPRRPRKATAREIGTLRALLVDSLLADEEGEGSLVLAAAQVRRERELIRRREAERGVDGPAIEAPAVDANGAGSGIGGAEPVRPPEHAGMRIRIWRLGARLRRRRDAEREPAFHL